MRKQLIKNKEELDQLIMGIPDGIEMSWDLETSNLDWRTNKIAGISIAWNVLGEVNSVYISVGHRDINFDFTQEDLKRLIANRKVITFHGKFDCKSSHFSYGWYPEIYRDVQLLAALRQRPELGLKDLASALKGGKIMIRASDLTEDFDFTQLDCSERVVEYGCQDAEETLFCCEYLEKLLVESGQQEIVDLEMYIYNMMIKPEIIGLTVDMEGVKRGLEEYEEELDKLEDQIFSMVKVEKFKINSSQKLANLLFNVLGMQPTISTKTGWSTSKEALELIDDQHLILDLIIEWKSMFSVRNSMRKLPERVIDGKLYPDWRQVGIFENKGSARMYSEKPSATSIPKQIRNHITPSEI